MSDKPSEDRLFDEKLAEFTDRLLDEKTVASLPSLAEEEELQRLQKLVMRLKQAGLADCPRASFSARMRAAILKEWQHSGLKPSLKSSLPAPDHPGFFRQITNTCRQIFAARGQQIAIVVTVLLLFCLLLLPENPSLAGAAGTAPGLSPVCLLIGVTCLGLLIWLLIRKKE